MPEDVPEEIPEDEPADQKEREEGEEAGDELSDAELEAEMAEGAASFSKPAPKGKGVIWGVVKDGEEHDTLPEAQLSVPGTNVKTLSDYDGRFRLELPPGKYTIRVYFELYRPTVVKEITVLEGEVQRVDVDLLPDEAAVDTVEVVADADRSTLEGQMISRQRSAAVGDGVGRAEISKTPAGNAAQAAQRVVGATIVGNRFVYVRGLGERYTNALLNGAPLPSPEPDRAAIPLDLFPSLILESVTIVKTFTPDVPGDFAGGSVRIETRELPSKPLFQVALGGSYDTNTTFRDRLGYRGSKTDWLGFDDSMRPLPDEFPKYVLQPGEPKPGGGTIEGADLVNAGRLANSSMNPKTTFSLPNYGLSVVAGNGFRLGGEQRFGALASINYSRSFKRRDDVLLRVYAPDANDPGEADVERNLRADIGEDKVSWGALGSVSYWPDRRHRFTLQGIHTQLADSSTQLTRGVYENSENTLTTARLRYVSRAMNFLQLRGEHEFPELNHAELDWNASYAVASRAEPDTRDTIYTYDEVLGSWLSSNLPENGAHLYSDQTEKSYGAGLDWTQPVTKDPEDAKFKLGGLVSIKDRDFAARRFNYSRPLRGGPSATEAPFACPGVTYDLDCPVPIYQYDNIGSILNFSENTKPEDAYTAGLEIYAGYLMLDANVFDDLRLVGGARVERTDQSIDPYSQFSSGSDPKGASIESTDVLPALALTYSATSDTKLRAGVSRTLARPQIRELSPFTYTDYFGALPGSGEPDLELTYIQNVDLRFEFFPTIREVLAFSFFYKIFDDPIEPYIYNSGEGVTSYQNADGARLLGLELEARKSLDFISESARNLALIGNLTLAHSRIELDPNALSIATNDSRAMVNQAPYVVNLALDYTNDPLGLGVRLLYNLIGPRIVAVGTIGLDDSYEQERHLLDLTVSKNVAKQFTLKLNATNLLDAPVVVTLGKEDRSDRIVSRYREGTIFALSGTYTY